MMKIKKMILCLLAMGLMGNMIMPLYTMAKESPAPFDLYNSYAPGEDIPEENDIATEDAPEFVFGKKTSGPITAYYVDWGENKSMVKVKNIEAKGGKKYGAKFDLIYYDSLNKSKTKFANGVFYLKKTGKNDFAVTKLEVKKAKGIRFNMQKEVCGIY